MTIYKSYSISCTQCGRQFSSSNHESSFESEDEAIDSARDNGWSVRELVPNGSLWDFCPRCVKVNNEG